MQRFVFIFIKQIKVLSAFLLGINLQVQQQVWTFYESLIRLKGLKINLFKPVEKLLLYVDQGKFNEHNAWCFLSL